MAETHVKPTQLLVYDLSSFVIFIESEAWVEFEFEV